MKHFSIVLSLVLLICLIMTKSNSQIIFFTSDSTRFVTNEIDSVLILAEDIAVTASGENLNRIQLQNNEIIGQNLPPTLKLRNPIAAILYHQRHAFREIPVIIGRLNQKTSLDKVIRDYMLNISDFKGHSEKGGLKINVWQRDLTPKPFSVFLKNGSVLVSSHDVLQNIPSKNLSLFEINDIAEIEQDIAGIWIYPPEFGMNQLTGQILKYMQTSPLLVEYWDGFGWQFFEQAFLSQLVQDDPGEVQMAFSLFPPETEPNYTAMVSGGSTDNRDKNNLFTALSSLGTEYQVLEGDKLFFPIPGNVRLHSGNSPEQKDTEIFQAAESIVEHSQLPLLFLHYHGLDDLNHSFGTKDHRTIKHFQRLWKWHQELRKNWYGNMIIISDHGAHSINNGEQQNQTSDIAGTLGTHGEFIFSDMAVPIIKHSGLGKIRFNFELTTSQVEQIWNLVGTPIESIKTEMVDQVGSFRININNISKRFSIKEHHALFSNDFVFEYLKKGKSFKGHFKGIRLADLLKELDLSSIIQITAYSFDGHQVFFLKDDLIKNELVVGLNVNAQNPVEAFTLYPLKDKFPNRMVKQLKMIDVF